MGFIVSKDFHVEPHLSWDEEIVTILINTHQK